jgi:hypothetical protein
MYATVQEVIDRTSFPEVSELPEEKILGYIERAESWLHRSTRRKFREEKDTDVLVDLRTATILLVEYLWYQDNPDIKEDALSPVDSEKIGSYSYTVKKVQPGEQTGIPELDSILDSLKVGPVTGTLFFSISGPGCGSQ